MRLKFVFAFLFPLPLVAQTGNPMTVDISKACYKAISVPARPDFLTAYGNDAWVIDDANNLIKKISVDHTSPVLAVSVPGACAAPITAFNAIWVLSCIEKKLYRIDMNTGKILAKIVAGIADTSGEMSLAAGDGSVWMLSSSSGLLTRIDAKTNTVRAMVKVQPRSYCAGYGFNAIWVTRTGESTVQRVDVKTNTVPCLKQNKGYLPDLIKTAG